MTGSVQSSQDNNSVTIRINGRFDYNTHREFRSAYEDAGSNARQFTVDLSQTDYIDSSALGMLLQLREHAGGDSSKVTIVNTRPEVKSILDIANFSKLFHIA